MPIPNGEGKFVFLTKLQDSDNCLSFDLLGKVHNVSCSMIYKYMGTNFSARLGMAHEVASRTGAIVAGVKSFSKALRNPDIPIRVKLSIVRIYLLTTGSFQCCTWANLTKAQSVRFQKQ